MSTGGCVVRTTKVRTGVLTVFIPHCRCGWKGWPTGRAKATLQAEIHKQGGTPIPAGGKAP